MKTEATHHTNVRAYQRELAVTPEGLKRNRLLNLIARAKVEAADNGWPETDG